MFYPVDAATNSRFSQPPPVFPPMMLQLQAPAQQQHPGYWVYCPPPPPPTFGSFTGSAGSSSSVSNGRPQQPTASSFRDQSKKENKLAQVYKTELCRQFTDYGRCNYGNRCGYAHGEEELRQPAPRAPKFRTEVCVVFNQIGHCPNGERCHFVHDNSSLSFTSKMSSLPRSSTDSFGSSPTSSSATSSPAAQFDLSNEHSFWPSVHSFATADYSPNYATSMMGQSGF